jgi:hypothetical protein
MDINAIAFSGTLGTIPSTRRTKNWINKNVPLDSIWNIVENKA